MTLSIVNNNNNNDCIKFTDLFVEIQVKILRDHLDPTEILRIRQVSRLFQAISIESMKTHTAELKKLLELLQTSKNEKEDSSNDEGGKASLLFKTYLEKLVEKGKDQSLTHSTLSSLYHPLKKDQRFISIIAKRLHHNFSQFPDFFKENKNVMLIVVQQNGLALQHAPKSIRKDQDVVFAAIEQNGLALQYAAHNFKKDKATVLRAAQRNPAAILQVSRTLIGDPDIKAALEVFKQFIRLPSFYKTT